jgi:hypothetical protein
MAFAVETRDKALDEIDDADAARPDCTDCKAVTLEFS